MLYKKKNIKKLKRCNICNRYFNSGAMIIHLDKVHPLIKTNTKTDSIGTLSIVLCQRCGEYFDGNVFARHIKQCNGNNYIKNKKDNIKDNDKLNFKYIKEDKINKSSNISSKIGGVKVTLTPLQKNILDKAKKCRASLKIILISKRPTKRAINVTCEECGKLTDVAYCYKTKISTVFIGWECRERVFKRSFEKRERRERDAMDNALQGGAFDSNRRRH